ncbi:MAG: PEP-CTERM sorting domain-containing protein [Armatimonadetes bacterium]|nr:PEP-CTERM sorting domain-containing protein [Armatimonadota bacterium]
MKHLLSALAIAVFAASAHAVTIWDESVDGDLSGDRSLPTDLTFTVGTNTLIATSVQGDREYVHFHLPTGAVLSELWLTSWVGNDQIGFIAVQEGSVFTEPPTNTDVSKLLGYSHMGPGAGNLGQDILPAIGQGPGSIGFVPPLTGSDYTFWIQQTGANAVTYSLDYVVTPEPASLVVFAALGAVAVGRRRRVRA